jgi:alpha-glucosidase (family GH31 glycosyl hydrolase)
MIIPEHFKVKLDSTVNPAAVVKTGHARFSILTPRLIRMEWSPMGVFEDRASQAFWFRAQPAPAFEVKQDGKEWMIETEALRIHYMADLPFTKENLWVELKNFGQEPTLWHFGDPDAGNLGGTARTLDGVDGATAISYGLVSQSGWSLVDDSASLVFNEVGWLEPRNAPTGQMDLYFLGYGHDYFGCLKEFNRVSGAVPMIPRFVLGNWWSRYWEYTQDELKQLMDDFQAHEVPLSVCIIDMDWHITQTGNDSSGWTGYSWNRKLFPDPEGTLQFLHEKGLKVALNLHPAEGIHRHEDMYTEMCAAIGQDPKLGQPVEFDITNPQFVDAYFNILHHPQEEKGIDFWWMDWQQGQRTRLSGLDPLWWLNHLHFLDLGRDGKRRSFIFSRWGGLGNHRYPIGFSGDTVVSWNSLAFQPYFTATASNVNYGWWSHDIGGHMSGIEDAELYARWVQLGAFLPILRLHSTKNAYHDRRPWGFDAETFEATRAAMQLRHALIPYLYSMAWRYHRESIPPLLPMYYEHPEQPEAYACPNQYEFGSQLVVSPFITPKDADTRLSRSVVWLPEGNWYDFNNGQYYPGDGHYAIYGTLRDIPFFAKAGAIVPLGPLAGWGNMDTPDHLTVHVFPGADGSFELYEDEGNTNAYLEGKYAITQMTQQWDARSTTFHIEPAQGDRSVLPVQRTVQLVFRGFNAAPDIQVVQNGTPVPVAPQYDPNTWSILIDGLTLAPTDQITVTIRAGKEPLANLKDERGKTCLNLLHHFRMETGAKAALAGLLPEILQDPAKLGRHLLQLTESQFRALMETITGAGIEYSTATGKGLLLMWNNAADPHVTHQFALGNFVEWWHYRDQFPWSDQGLPKFKAYWPEAEFGPKNDWYLQVNYYNVDSVKLKRTTN